MDRPSIKASFVLDEQGNPETIRSRELKHYRIRLQVENVPDDAYAVTYELDPSYYEPIRESIEGDDEYAEEVTSYGDYVVRAKIRSKTRTETVAVPLSGALELGHRADLKPAIREAIEDIRKG